MTSGGTPLTAEQLVRIAYSHIAAAAMQLAPSDDQIIAEHIRAAEELLLAALRPKGRQVIADDNDVCEACAMTLDVEDCGAAQYDAIWFDANGNTDGKVKVVCFACLHAGHPEGPGYRAA